MDLEERKTKAKENFTEFLRSKGGRVTPERMAVVEEAAGFKSKFTIDDLKQGMSARNFQIAHGTLYNTVHELLNAQMIRKVQIGKIAYYQFCDGKSRNFHLVCTRCGKITEFQHTELEMLLESYKPKRFTMSEYNVSIEGICSTCAAVLRKLERKNNKKTIRK